jgi:OOP family OmpA-OmpF porin
MHQAIAGEFAGSLGANYVLHDDLRVTAASQDTLDRALAGSTIEFEPGSALLTDDGKQTLDGIIIALRSVDPRKIEVIGHTDNIGDAAKNMALSQARADSVKVYLVARGMAPERIRTSGMGEDQPIMPNTTEEGRRRNRRIEFRISE